MNDGLLSTESSERSSGRDDYTVDYSTTTGKATRWTNGHGGDFGYPDMSSNDSKALTYTTMPLKKNTEVTGHPVVHLWVTSTAEDGDFFVYLEETDAEDYSHYLAEGVLRATHRALTKPPFEYMGLPYHRSFERDQQPLPKNTPVELVFDLTPVSNIFNKGQRIRVTVACGDRDNYLTPELSPPPTVSIHRNTKHASYITLPIIQ
jgi:putative CocE/NonD family hydrolase